MWPTHTRIHRTRTRSPCAQRGRSPRLKLGSPLYSEVPGSPLAVSLRADGPPTPPRLASPRLSACSAAQRRARPQSLPPSCRPFPRINTGPAGRYLLLAAPLRLAHRPDTPSAADSARFIRFLAKIRTDSEGRIETGYKPREGNSGRI